MTSLITTLALCAITIAIAGMYSGYSASDMHSDYEPRRRRASIPRVLVEGRLVSIHELQYRTVDVLRELDHTHRGTDLGSKIHEIRASKVLESRDELHERLHLAEEIGQHLRMVPSEPLHMKSSGELQDILRAIR